MAEKKLLEIYPKTKYLAITWQVNDHCNYKCSYCNPGNWSGNHKNDKHLNIYLKNLKMIVDRYLDDGYGAFKIYLSGGEPTIWKHLLPVVEFFKEYTPNNTIAINTNLSRATNWWEKYYHLFDDVVASFHIESVNKQRYFENSLLMCDKISYFCNKMLMHEERFWEVVEYGEMLKEKLPGYVIEWTPLFDEMSGNASPWKYKETFKDKWLEEHRDLEVKWPPNKIYKESLAVSMNRWDDGSTSSTNSNELIIKRENFFSGWDCDIGDSIFINPAGYVSMGSCGLSGNVGHILENIDGIGPKTITCSKYHCHCGTDIIIPKRSFKNA
jgi:organic radical activating enzyme